MKHKALSEIHQELGISSKHFEGRNLSFFAEAPLENLVVVGLNYFGHPVCLEKEAAKAWFDMEKTAQKEKILLHPISGFRSFLYQKLMVQDRLTQGRELTEILRNIAAPGFSEHHTGCAIDINTSGCEPISEAFEETDAFQWLCNNAADFSFTLSFPRGNSQGYIYEPWHWCYKAQDV